jgi:hypothetical protein
MRLRRQRRAEKFIHPHAAAVECCRTALPAAVNRETLAADSRECPKAKMAITSCGVMVMESPYQSQLRSTCSCGCSTKKKLIGARPDCLPRELRAGVDDLSRRPKAQSGAMAFARPAWTRRSVTAPWVHRFFVQICRQNEKRKLLQLCLNPLILPSCDLARWRTRLTGCFVCLRKILTPNFVFPGCCRIPLHLRI